MHPNTPADNPIAIFKLEQFTDGYTQQLMKLFNNSLVYLIMKIKILPLKSLRYCGDKNTEL